VPEHRLRHGPGTREVPQVILARQARTPARRNRS